MATFEELESIVIGIGKAMRESEEIRLKSEKEIAEFRAKSEKEAAEIRAKSEKELAEIRAKSAEARAKYDAELAEIRKKNEQTREDLTKNINYWTGRFGNTTGYITEMILLPGIRKKMDKLGHRFDSVAARKEFYRKKDGGALAEADLILENGKEVMIVEVKTHLRRDDVRDQIERLNLLRKNEKDARVEGKTLISGVAGVVIDKNAKKMAKERGMYIIQMVETEKNITVEPPETVGCW
ncbi:hypothetical protein R80B4_01012 [Fibrobacteres bacterium R8-0-B4]